MVLGDSGQLNEFRHNLNRLRFLLLRNGAESTTAVASCKHRGLYGHLSPTGTTHVGKTLL